MKYKCTMTDCTMNQGGNCHLGATQVYTLGCQKYIEKVSQTVSFATAWKAYEEGKTIQWGAMRFSKQHEHGGWPIPRESIRGQWIILED